MRMARVVAMAALVVAVAVGVTLGATLRDGGDGADDGHGGDARDGAAGQPADVHGEGAGRAARVESGAGGGLRHTAGDSVHAAGVGLD